ncbi:MAG TPA: PilZ domain-containing protein [Gammaproteobacteria bacterium]|nr:PilZ domain-containing protein [Gammaproteobacteria bacterium]
MPSGAARMSGGLILPCAAACLMGESRRKGKGMERRLLPRSKVSTRVYLSVPGGRPHRCRARNLSAMGVFLEIEALGLPAGTVVNLVFAVNLGNMIRLHRRQAIVAHVSERGAGLMMQGRPRLRPSADRAVQA